MKTSKKTNLSRALATGLALALAGGVSLVAAAPAHAVDATYLDPSTPDVFEADIRSAQADPLGWHMGTDGASATISSAGLMLNQGDILSYTFDDSYERVLEYNLSASINNGDATWTTAAENTANYQMVFSYGETGVEPSYTVLTSTNSVTGKNTASLDQTWTTSNAMRDEFDAGGNYELRYLVSFLEDQPNGKLVSFGVTGVTSAVVSSLSWETGTYTFRDGTRMVPGTVTLAGTPTVGSVITAETAGWPEGATFDYEWFEYSENSGGELDGTAATHTIGADSVGYSIGAFITVSAPNKYPATVRASTEPVTAGQEPAAAAQEPAAAAPVATSAELAAFLTAARVETGTAASAGLPADGLDATKPYTATVDWAAADGFVDVYAYSTPVLVGTFPVVNGQVQIVLSSAMLSALAAGSHTLVITGQSSGSVQAVAFSITKTLAATGVNPMLPLGSAALMLMLGVALVIVRRRRTLV